MAAIELANQLLELNMTDDQKLFYASEVEGHPDNAGASLFGGLLIGLHEEDKTHAVKVQHVDVDVVVVIPFMKCSQRMPVMSCQRISPINMLSVRVL